MHYCIKADDDNAMGKVYLAIKDIVDKDRETVFICIGSDRTIGDSFGPFVGLKLRRLLVNNVYGTIYDPIHANNLKTRVKEIKTKHPNAFIVAVDACLCSSKRTIGDIVIKREAINPGSGVGNDLGAVGNASIVGYVNTGNYTPYEALRMTRLSRVMKMARITSIGIAAAFVKSPIINYVAATK